MTVCALLKRSEVGGSAIRHVPAKLRPTGSLPELCECDLQTTGPHDKEKQRG